MDYSTLCSARRASCLNAKLYGGRHSFPRLPRASSLLSMTIVERNDSSNDLTRRIFRDLVPFSLIGRSRLFSPSANWHEKQPQDSNLVWGILEDSVRGREMPFSREALPELRQLGGEVAPMRRSCLEAFGFSMEFWKICVDWDTRRSNHSTCHILHLMW